ncbi:MAG: hypothetical protein JMN27_04965 [gamma proteobacterium endosymbiont of Lamellibrachia anaximandri]|nr:hypothetical protein [gamma proteobacterium endosymbiont of Lamellibrachia anaximandri]MBL3533166.1 hypothetical protein [gamma proteobacterium endosymbiont of Lamellibrachia anaximandri]MBL3598488.1 hypothetical protein [gamma proteobacterium endosymbiont of Lamellibrachia anaximandri]
MKTLLAALLLTLWSQQTYAFFCFTFSGSGGERYSRQRAWLPPAYFPPAPHSPGYPLESDPQPPPIRPVQKPVEHKVEIINGYRFRALGRNRTNEQAKIPRLNH